LTNSKKYSNLALKWPKEEREGKSKKPDTSSTSAGLPGHKASPPRLVSRAKLKLSPHLGLAEARGQKKPNFWPKKAVLKHKGAIRLKA